MSGPPLNRAESGATVDQAFAFQSAICRHLGGEMYAELLERCAHDEAALTIVGDWPGDLLQDFVPLRLLGGVHQLVLEGRLPELARHYPTTGGQPSWPGAWVEFRSALTQHPDFLRGFLSTTPQTNEIARSAALAAGFHEVAREFGLPLRLRELGASAGLNLLFDRYAYEFGSVSWGERDGRPLLQPDWSGPPPALAEHLAVESRAGCDLAPIDLRDPVARARLRAYVWADQPERLARLTSAIELAMNDLPRLDRCPAGDWIGGELESLPVGATTIVYHSSFWTYLPDSERSAIREQIERAGAGATPKKPLAWLRLEDVETRVDLWLRSWPGGSDRRLAETNPHGRWIHWQPGAAVGA